MNRKAIGEKVIKLKFSLSLSLFIELLMKQTSAQVNGSRNPFDSWSAIFRSNPHATLLSRLEDPHKVGLLICLGYSKLLQVQLANA